MKKYKIYIIILFFSLSILACKNKSQQDNSSNKEHFIEMQIPHSFKKIDEIFCDLDSDSNEEKILVYNTDKVTKNGIERILYICKKNKDDWKLWKTISGPILPSKYNESLVDPYDGIVVQKNKIFISHNGETEFKWYFNHCYSFIDGEFKLVKAVIDIGKECEQWETFIYDLVNSKINYEKTVENCDDLVPVSKTIIKKSYSIPKQELPLMQNFIPGTHQIQIQNSNNLLVNF